jgi:CRISPR-associated endonuclease/helicase Cas3
MIQITLQAHAEKIAPAGAIPEYLRSEPLLYHQVRTYNALKDSPMVMNTYPTGTGKTVAALLRLLHPEQRSRNTLIIAPTNALIAQHAAEVREFIARHGLTMRVFEADAAALGPLAPDLRPGERLQRFLENPLTFAEQLSLPETAKQQPFVIITNPDIFYYGLYFQYQRNDQRNVFTKFIYNFSYLVIDEFHYYDNKQFANFLFFFALWKQWDYFKHGRSICLLSATPRDNVYHYLNHIFGKGDWVQINPYNEPLESETYATIPTLTELRLTITADQIDEWVVTHLAEIESWQSADLDSAIISSSLGRISEIHHTLRHLTPTRITGPEPHVERQRIRPLILATPTVDIGYNFGRPGKSRQSIDRLVCDARFGDELTQRIGRAGRVLGRKEMTQPSEAVVIVSDDAVSELRSYDGQTLSRHAWAALVAKLEYLPPKHRLEGYIRSQSIMEAFYPIYQINQLMPVDESALEELYQMIRDLFSPQSKQSAKGLAAFFRTYDKRRIWCNTSESQRWLLDERNAKVIAQHFADYISWRKSSKGVVIREPAEKYRSHLVPLLLNQPQQKKDLLAFIESQVALTKAIFNFREAWQGPVATLFDPQHLLSSETVNQYDLLHLLTNYTLHWFRDRQAFEHEAGPTEPAEIYVELADFRRPKLTLGFDYTSELDRTEFEERYCRSVVALRGLRLTAKERGVDGQPVLLQTEIRELIEDHWVPCLVVAEESWWPLLSILRSSPFYTRELQVDFPDGTTTLYKIVTGTSAFHILPELKRHYAMQDKKLSDDAIIL